MNYQIVTAENLVENVIVLDPDHVEAFAATLEEGKTLRPETEENMHAPRVAPELSPAHRILKDTLILRVKEAGAISGLMQLIGSLTPEQQFEFNQMTWFWSDNPMIVGGVHMLQLDPETILAQDPLAPQ